MLFRFQSKIERKLNRSDKLKCRCYNGYVYTFRHWILCSISCRIWVRTHLIRTRNVATSRTNLLRTAPVVQLNGDDRSKNHDRLPLKLNKQLLVELSKKWDIVTIWLRVREISVWNKTFHSNRFPSSFPLLINLPICTPHARLIAHSFRLSQIIFYLHGSCVVRVNGHFQMICLFMLNFNRKFVHNLPTHKVPCIQNRIN